MKKNEVIFAGIDVSKGYADFHLMNECKTMVEKGFQLDDNQHGHQILKEIIGRYTSNGITLIFGIENTGGYEQNWVELLKKMKKSASVEVYKLNPKAVKHQIASHLKRTINDGVSAEGIAEYVANNYQQYRHKWSNSTYHDPTETSLQQLFRYINSLIKQQTAKSNQLEKLLYQNFPEMLSFCKNGKPIWLLQMLCKYPTALNVRKASVERLDAIKGITQKKAREMKELADKSVAKQSLAIDQMIIKELVETILYYQRKINTLKQLLIDSYMSPSVALLKTIKGIGDWSAAALVLLLGDISKFKDTNQLVAFYGVHPRFKQSGDGKWGVKMSKQGDKHMRALLFVAANNVIIHNPYFSKLYKKHLAAGKKPKAAKGIIMHKLLRIIYGMLKTQTAFDPKVDEINQEKSLASVNQQLPLSTAVRRYQSVALNAPISRTNHKRRRAVLEHQTSSKDVNTVSSQTALEQK